MDTWSWKFDKKFHTSYSTFVPMEETGRGKGGGSQVNMWTSLTGESGSKITENVQTSFMDGRCS